MNKIFIGGSRKISRLSKDVLKRIDNIINNDLTVLVGDANGVDKCVQKYLFQKNYRNVIVFCTGFSCRNNIGSWETRNVEVNGKVKGFDLYTIKDMEMAKESSHGFMIWNAKSRGTLNNIINLLKENKVVLVYFTPDKSFYKIKDLEALADLLSRCDPDDVRVFKEKLSISQILSGEQRELELS
ncbi:MAG: hypothetical protein N2378_14340 [Chloroflexaceae bacterium]|nr:hypothetical protein [Chloroflexaceae bacterium]